MNSKGIISLSLLGCFCAPAYSANFQKLESIKAVTFQGGSHTAFYGAVQNDTSGGARKADFAPTIGSGIYLPWSNGFSFVPEINWVLPQESGSSRVIKNLFMFRADFGYSPLDWLRLRAGTSLMWQNIHGRGGREEVNNGNSTSTFYYPDENRSALNNTFDLGLEGFFLSNWSARLQTYTYSLFDHQRRQVSYTLFLTYHWSL